MKEDMGALTGSREPSLDGLGPSGFDPERVLRDTGYFDGPGDIPAYDPGSEALCPVCDRRMGELNAGTTLSRCVWVVNNRSHFFYYHAACAGEGKPRIDAFEQAVVGQIIAQESPQ